MARDPQFVLKYLEEVELLAEDVLADKQQIVDLDKKRNFNREALAALHKKTLAPPHSVNKVWVNFGGVFVKMEKVKLITNKPIKPTKTRTIRKDSKNKTFKPIRLYTCKTEKGEATAMINHDLNELSKEIKKVQKELKSKVNKLRDAQNQEELKGFDLTPLTRQETGRILSRPNR